MTFKMNLNYLHNLFFTKKKKLFVFLLFEISLNLIEFSSKNHSHFQFFNFYLFSNLLKSKYLKYLKSK